MKKIILSIFLSIIFATSSFAATWFSGCDSYAELEHNIEENIKTKRKSVEFQKNHCLDTLLINSYVELRKRGEEDKLKNKEYQKLRDEMYKEIQKMNKADILGPTYIPEINKLFSSLRIMKLEQELLKNIDCMKQLDESGGEGGYSFRMFLVNSYTEWADRKKNNKPTQLCEKITEMRENIDGGVFYIDDITKLFLEFIKTKTQSSSSE